MLESFRIPRERIAVLIGKKGSVKERIEKETKTRINVDSKSGIVEVESEKEDVVLFQKAVDIVKAIARGFSPENAFRLLQEDYYLDVVDLSEFAGKSERELTAKKGRIIGRNGKTKREIEDCTGVLLSIFGKTVALIGNADGMENARKAVEMLMQGASHNTVSSFLKRKEIEEKTQKFEL